MKELHLAVPDYRLLAVEGGCSVVLMLLSFISLGTPGDNPFACLSPPWSTEWFTLAVALAIVLVFAISYAHELNRSLSLIGGNIQPSPGHRAKFNEKWLLACIIAACKAFQALAAVSMGSGLLSPKTLDGSLLVTLASLALYTGPLIAILIPHQDVALIPGSKVLVITETKKRFQHEVFNTFLSIFACVGQQ